MNSIDTTADEMKTKLKTYIHNSKSKLHSYQTKLGRCKTIPELDDVASQCLDDLRDFYFKSKGQCKSEKVKTLMGSVFHETFDGINKAYDKTSAKIHKNEPMIVINDAPVGVYKVPEIQTNYPPLPSDVISVPKKALNNTKDRDFVIESLVEYMTKCGIYLMKNMMGMTDRNQLKTDLNKEKDTFLNQLSSMSVPSDLNQAMQITAERFVATTLNLDSEPYRTLSKRIYQIMIDFNEFCSLSKDRVKDYLSHEEVREILDNLKLTYHVYNKRIEMVLFKENDVIPFENIKTPDLLNEYLKRMAQMYNETVEEIANIPTKSFMEAYNEVIKKNDQLIEEKFNELINQGKGMSTETMTQMKSTLKFSRHDEDDFIGKSYKEIHNRIMKSYMDTFDRFIESVLSREYEMIMHSIKRSGDVDKLTTFKIDRRDEVKARYRKRMCDAFIGSHSYDEYDKYPAEQSYMDDWENEESIEDLEFRDLDY